MSQQREREDFLIRLVREFPARPAHEVQRIARLLLRHAKTHHRIAEALCNGALEAGGPGLPIDYVNRRQAEHAAWCEKRSAQLERRIAEVCAELGCSVSFSGDPRGYTVRLHLPSARGNTWGGDTYGWGVPQ